MKLRRKSEGGDGNVVWCLRKDGVDEENGRRRRFSR